MNDLANQLADNSLARQMNAIGAQRLGGYIGSSQVMGRSTVRAINGAISGVTMKNKHEAYERTLRLITTKVQKFIYPTGDNEGLVEFTNLSTNLPYDGAPLVGESAIAALRTFARNKEQLGEGNSAHNKSCSCRFFAEKPLQFGDEAILSERVLDVLVEMGKQDKDVFLR